MIALRGSGVEVSGFLAIVISLYNERKIGLPARRSMRRFSFAAHGGPISK
jgi:hypothetical protein